MRKFLLPFLMVFTLLFSSCSPKPEEENPEPPAPEATVLGETEKDISEENSKVLQQPEEFLLCAYLPLNAVNDISQIPEGSLEMLDYLILNTGVYWNQQGELLVAENFDFIARQLSQKVNLYATVNPKGSMIREGQAGTSIDTLEKRQALSQNIAEFAAEYNLAGIDIDWEFPEETEWELLGELLLQLEQDLGERQLSLAFYPKNISLPEDSFHAVDRIHIMAYDLFDQQGFHSTLETAVSSVEYFIEMGFEPQQLSLGIPAYGRPLDASAQWVFYKDIDPTALSSENPDLMGNIYFNSPALAAQKIQLAKEYHLGGAMLYHLLCDKTQQDSILYAMKKAAE